MNDIYFQQLKDILGAVITQLSLRGIPENRLSFGGPGPEPTRKPTVPTDARSEFLANRAMGDWAEDILAASLRSIFPDHTVTHFGDSGRIAAGDPNFRQHYLAGLEETRLKGKRPDLLIFPARLGIDQDISEQHDSETEALAPQADAAIEVRSSKFEALKYIQVKQAEGKSGRVAPSFTVKVEDLVIVYRWLERNRVPQIYCQVFFDSIFAINFLEIFKIIGSGDGFTVESPKKSQEKATIMIPITSGLKVGTSTTMPGFVAEHKVTKLGRHDAYVVPQGGSFILDAEKMRQVLMLVM